MIANASIETARRGTLALSRDISAICEPLFRHTEITTFFCVKFYPDGSRNYVSSNPGWIDCYFDQKFFNDLLHTHTYGLDLDDRGMSLWSSFDKDEIFSAAHQFNIWHGITFFEKVGDEHTAYLFASTTNNHQIINFYLSNIDLLNQFIFYFKERSQKLLNQMNKEIIIPPEKPIAVNQSANQLWVDKKAFMQEIEVKRYYVNSRVYLTQREVQCVTWVAEGKTADEVAVILGISQRTVESYIESAKNKLACHKITQLIEKAMALGLVSSK